MTSQRQLPAGGLPEVPYFTLDMHRRADTDAVEVLLTGDLDELTVGHLDDSLSWIVEHMTQRSVVVDVTGVTRIEGCAVTSLTTFRSRLAADRRTLSTRGAEGANRRVLGAVGLRDTVPHAGPEA